MKILFSQEIVLTFVLFFSKLSIFSLFFQIFQVHTFMRIALRFGIVFAALLYFTNIPMSAILSAPRAGDTWTSVLFSGRPQKDLIWGVVQSALSIVLDLFIFILPIPIVLKLNLSRKKRIQILAVFGTALVGVVASVLSLVYRVAAIGTNDGTWKYTSLLICSVVESDVAVIVSCAPGFANFTRVYVAELPIINPILSSFGRSSCGVFDLPCNSPSSRPRLVGKGARKQENHEFDVLGDTLGSTPSNGGGGISYGPGTYDYPLQTSSMDKLVAGRLGEH